jgi:hypothetical protein
MGAAEAGLKTQPRFPWTTGIIEVPLNPQRGIIPASINKLAVLITKEVLRCHIHFKSDLRAPRW